MYQSEPAIRRRVASVTEAAAMLGISRSHAYELVARGELPSVRLGRRLLVPLTAIEKILWGSSGASKGDQSASSSARASVSATGASLDSTAWA